MQNKFSIEVNLVWSSRREIGHLHLRQGVRHVSVYGVEWNICMAPQQRGAVVKQFRARRLLSKLRLKSVPLRHWTSCMARLSGSNCLYGHTVYLTKDICWGGNLTLALHFFMRLTSWWQHQCSKTKMLKCKTSTWGLWNHGNNGILWKTRSPVKMN